MCCFIRLTKRHCAQCKQVNMQVNPQGAHMLKQQYLLCRFRLYTTHVAELLEKLPHAKGESLLTNLDCYCF
jgi:hypothetical protein